MMHGNYFEKNESSSMVKFSHNIFMWPRNINLDGEFHDIEIISRTFTLINNDNELVIKPEGPISH